MATYTITTSNYADPSFWSSISVSSSGHTLDFTQLPSSFLISVEPASSIIWIWDGSTWLSITEAGMGGSANFGSPTELHYFDEILVGDAQANLLGSDGADTLITGAGNDTIEGGLGDDSISAGGGNDSVNAGDGNDFVWGGDGNDTILGGAGNDTLSGEAGADTIEGGDGADRIQGGQGGDSLDGGAGEDKILGDGQWYVIEDFASVSNGAATNLTIINSADGPIDLWWIDATGTLQFYATIQPGGTYVQGTFEDHNWMLRDDLGSYLELIEGAANQTVDYGAEGLSDSISGGDDNDTIYGQFGNDTIDGGVGADLIYGGTGNDSLRGGDGDDTLYGDLGADTLFGGNDNDLIYGGDGNDRIFGDSGNDLVYGGDGADQIYGGAGNDTLHGDAGNDLIFTGTGQNEVHLGDGDDQVIMGAGNNLAFGGTGNDVFRVSGGNDTVYGGEGGDSLLGDILDISSAGPITVIATGDEQGVATFSSGSTTFYEIERVQTDSGNDLIDLSASTQGMSVITYAGADTVIGTSGNDYVSAFQGNDSVYGGAGNDTIYGGSGNDTIVGGAGNDQMFGEADRDTFLLADGHGTDTIFGGETGEDWDVIDASAVTGNTSVTFTGNEAGTMATGADSATFSQIEEIQLGSGSDTVDASATTVGVTVDTGAGDDSILGGSGADTINAGDGNDTLRGGGGDDLLTTGDGADTIILTTAGGQDTVTDFDTTLIDGKVVDQLDVSDLVNASGDPVTWQDVVVTDTNGDGTGDAILTFPGGESIVLQGVAPDQVDGKQEMAQLGIPCFAAGSPILTPSGPRPVETLTRGDFVITQTGPAPVIWAGSRSLGPADLAANPGQRPIHFAAGAIGNSVPLRLSPQHAVQIVGSDGSPVLVRAKHLAEAGLPGVRIARGVKSVTYHHLLLQRHSTLSAAGASVETMYPGHMALGSFPIAARLAIAAAIIGIHRVGVAGVIDLANLTQIYGPRCFPLLGRREALRACQTSGAFQPFATKPQLPRHSGPSLDRPKSERKTENGPSTFGNGRQLGMSAR